MWTPERAAMVKGVLTSSHTVPPISSRSAGTVGKPIRKTALDGTARPIVLRPYARRRVKEKALPLPGWLSTHIFSPISSIISLAMDKPNPEPSPEWALSTL